MRLIKSMRECALNTKGLGIEGGTIDLVCFKTGEQPRLKLVTGMLWRVLFEDILQPIL